MTLPNTRPSNGGISVLEEMALPKFRSTLLTLKYCTRFIHIQYSSAINVLSSNKIIQCMTAEYSGNNTQWQGLQVTCGIHYE
jgi:hypothetical protein